MDAACSRKGWILMQQTVEYKVKSLAKAVRVLECFSVQNPEMGVSEIAHTLNYQKSTVFNILSTFEELGYVSQNVQTGKYYLSLKILHFSYIVNSHLDFRRVFQQPINQIAQEIGEVCYLGIPHDRRVLYLDAAFPQSSSTYRSIMGETAPMYCTGLGKALLAFLPEEERQSILAEPLEKFTDYTITDLMALTENLDEVRRNGFSVDNMEHEYGIRCVAVPVFNSERKVVAAVSVSGPSLRFSPVAVLHAYEVIQDKLQALQYKL